jgi:hypothetical protein
MLTLLQTRAVPPSQYFSDYFGDYFDAEAAEQAEGVEPAEAEERPAGGWAAQNYATLERNRRLREQAEEAASERWDDAKQSELAALLQAKIAADESREMVRLKALVAEYASDAQREFLSRRGQRAVEYAQRSQTVLALQLAVREIERFEEEAIAVVLLLALDD